VTYHSNRDGFDNEDLNPNKQLRKPSISENITRTLARLMGFHVGTATWKLLQSDIDGRLLVSSSSTQTNTATNSNPTVGVASAAILNANPTRRQYIIYNNGSVNIYLGFGTAAVVTNSLPVPPGGIFIDDVFTGVVNAISGTAGQDVRVVEM
jgi:hypothetical protein